MKIVVLAGGTSTERDVSLVTGSKIYKALVENGHEVVLLDLYLGYEEEDYKDIFSLKKDWSEKVGAISEENPDMEQVRALRKDNPDCLVGPHVLDICSQADIVFLALHGQNGEDGKVQAMFDLMDIKYTGTDYLSSAIAMDKAISKQFFMKNGIPTPAGIHVKQGEKFDWEKYPAIVKVNRGGSSVGVYRVENENKLQEAMKKAFTLEKEVLVEEFIEGREFSIGVIDGKALPIIEIAPKVGFYDYKNKYQAGATVDTCPASLPEAVTLGMQKAAENVYAALGLKTYVRVDFRMNNKYEYYCLEANTLPGMTPTSLLPQEAAVNGMDFHALCEEIIRISLEKYC